MGIPCPRQSSTLQFRHQPITYLHNIASVERSIKEQKSIAANLKTIFLLSIFAEIYTTTGGGPGTATTILSYLIYALGLQQFDVGLASAGGILAVVLANVVAFFLVRMLAKNLKGEYES